MATWSPYTGMRTVHDLTCSLTHNQAVMQGRWVIIEDINLAPTEVLAALIPLLENRKLMIPQRAETLEATDGFQAMLTVTCAPKGIAAGAYVSTEPVKA